MKQWHRQITHIITRDRKSLHERDSGERHHHVCDPNRLGLATGTGCENQHEGVACRHFAVGRQLTCRPHQSSPLGGIDVEDPHTRKVQTLDQTAVRFVGEQDLAVGTRDIASQPVTAPGGVDATQDVATKARRRHRGEHLRGVTQQCAHVQRTGRVGHIDQRCGVARGLGQMLAPRPHLIAVLHRGSRVGGTFAEQLLDGVSHGHHVSASSAIPSNPVAQTLSLRPVRC